MASLKKIHPLVQKIFHLQDYELENEVKVTKILTVLKLVTMMYLCKFEENLSPGSKDIVGTRICHLNPPVTLKMRSNLISSLACHIDVSMQV